VLSLALLGIYVTFLWAAHVSKTERGAMKGSFQDRQQNPYSVMLSLVISQSSALHASASRSEQNKVGCIIHSTALECILWKT
jgi:hypothetical protein